MAELSSQELSFNVFVLYSWIFNFPVTDNPSTESKRKKNDALVHILLNYKY